MIRRVLGFELRGLVSLYLWATRRRHGVPAGSVPLPYASAQTTTLLMFLCALLIETIGVEALLWANDAPGWLRALVLTTDVYTILYVLALIGAGVTRPHVLSDDELRVRQGVYFDLRVPRTLVAGVRKSTNYNETGSITVTDGRLAVAVSSQTNVIVTLNEPVTATRPLGGKAQVREIRFYTDSPHAILALARPAAA